MILLMFQDNAKNVLVGSGHKATISFTLIIPRKLFGIEMELWQLNQHFWTKISFDKSSSKSFE